MADLKHKDKREVSRDDAAERLIAIAGALRTGGTAELAAEGQGISVQVAGQVRREREYEMKGGRVELELELSWPGCPGRLYPPRTHPLRQRRLRELRFTLAATGVKSAVAARAREGHVAGTGHAPASGVLAS